jgi:hypothetical protein
VLRATQRMFGEIAKNPPPRPSNPNPRTIRINRLQFHSVSYEWEAKDPLVLGRYRDYLQRSVYPSQSH